MSVSLKLLGIEQRLALVGENWDRIPADSAAIPVTEAQAAELDRRIADHEANPDDVVPWEKVKASIRKRIEK